MRKTMFTYNEYSSLPTNLIKSEERALSNEYECLKGTHNSIFGILKIMYSLEKDFT